MQTVSNPDPKLEISNLNPINHNLHIRTVDLVLAGQHNKPDAGKLPSPRRQHHRGLVHSQNRSP
jgi:hypothetical protein